MSGRASLGMEVLEGRLVPARLVGGDVQAAAPGGHEAAKHDYLLSNSPADTPVSEFARVFKAHHRVEECLQRAKGEAGPADYQVRTWGGWHHHQALSLI